MDFYLSLVPPVLTLLWGLVCLRIYTLISTENPIQRRMIAVGGAIGAALIYLLAVNITSLLRAPSSGAAQPDDRIKVQLKTEKKETR